MRTAVIAGSCAPVGGNSFPVERFRRGESMKPFAKIAVAFAALLALAGFAKAQVPKADHHLLSQRPKTRNHRLARRGLSSQWTPLNNQLCSGTNPCFPAGVTMLLTDGTVLVHEEQNGGERNWYKLTPDAFGSYVNGTWSKVASIPAGFSFAPLFLAHRSSQMAA